MSLTLQRAAALKFSVGIRLVADAALVAILLFISAGTLTWWRAWVLLGLMLFIRTLGAWAVYRVHPALLRERARLPIHGAQSYTDKFLLLSVLAAGFLGLPLIAGLDVFHWHVWPRPGALLGYGGLVLFAVGWSIKNLALRANAFATSVVRIQSERAHVVADTGIYAVIRHPFYAADPLIFIGFSLWLESYFGVPDEKLPGHNRMAAFVTIRRRRSRKAGETLTFHCTCQDSGRLTPGSTAIALTKAYSTIWTSQSLVPSSPTLRRCFAGGEQWAWIAAHRDVGPSFSANFALRWMKNTSAISGPSGIADKTCHIEHFYS